MSYLASTVVVGLGVQHLSNSGNGSAAVGSLIRSSNAEHGDVAPDASGGGDSAERAEPAPPGLGRERDRSPRRSEERRSPSALRLPDNSMEVAAETSLREG